MPAASEVMFCSATPALTNWSGSSAWKRSTTEKPRPPVTKTMRRSAFARSESAARKEGLIRSPRRVPRRLELSERALEVLAARRAVVVEQLVLHVGDTLALHRVGDDAARPADLERHRAERRLDRAEVVPVDFAPPPAQAAPLVGQRLEVDHLFDAAEALDLVVVDDHREVVEPVLRREQGGLPGRALVALAVGDHRPEALPAAVAPGGARHASGESAAVAERAGGNLDSRHVLVRGVAGEGGAVLGEGVEALGRG